MFNGNGNNPYPPMNDWRNKIISWLLDQGIAIIIMIGAVYVLYMEKNEQRNIASQCNDQMIELLHQSIEQQRVQNEVVLNLLKTVDNNTSKQ